MKSAYRSLFPKQMIDEVLPASGKTYTAIEDGWVLFDKRAGASAQYTQLANVSKFFNGSFTGYNNGVECPVFTPVNKNDIITIRYTTTGETSYFRFVKTDSVDIKNIIKY